MAENEGAPEPRPILEKLLDDVDIQLVDLRRRFDEYVDSLNLSDEDDRKVREFGWGLAQRAYSKGYSDFRSGVKFDREGSISETPEE